MQPIRMMERCGVVLRALRQFLDEGNAEVSRSFGRASARLKTRLLKRTAWSVAALVMFISPVIFASQSKTAETISPEALTAERTSLYLESGKKPLTDLAHPLYQLAVDSERCRVASGPKACGLSTAPLASGSLDEVFKYYVAQPVDANLSRQKVGANPSDWSWKSPAPPAAAHSAKQ